MMKTMLLIGWTTVLVVFPALVTCQTNTGTPHTFEETGPPVETGPIGIPGIPGMTYEELNRTIEAEIRAFEQELIPFEEEIIYKRSNKTAVKTDLGKDALTYLEALIVDAKGNPNARVTCTKGYNFAAKFVAAEMEKLGMEKFGNARRTTYFNRVPGSPHHTLCPHGITNVIGLVRGTQLPDEIIVYSAHLDGPNNYNPAFQPQPIIGNANTTDIYDNGLAVALGLAFAKNLASLPPKRSVLFIFDDGEEGWINVGTPTMGGSVLDNCWFSGDCTVEEHEFYERVKQETCPASLCNKELFAAGYRGYPIGLSSWTKNPTVDLRKIKAAWFGESLGPPPGMNTITALNGDAALYGANETMNNFLNTVLPTNMSFTLVRQPRIPLPNYGSIDSFSQYYEGLCGDNCLESGGIPSMSFITLAQQRYRGGAGTRINEVKTLFQDLTEYYPDLKATLNGTYPSPAFFSFDSQPSMDWARLDDLALMLGRVLADSANSQTVGNLMYDREPETDPLILGDANFAAITHSIDDMMALTPVAFEDAIWPIVDDVFFKIEDLKDLVLEDGKNITEAENKNLTKLYGFYQGFFSLLDFFNESYENKIPFDDEYQRFDKSEVLPPNEEQRADIAGLGSGTCGEGSSGNGICPISGHCCSRFGYCGTDAHHCEQLENSDSEL